MNKDKNFLERKEYYEWADKNLFDSIKPKEHKPGFAKYTCSRDKQEITSPEQSRAHGLCFLCRGYVIPGRKVYKAVNKAV